MSRVLSGENEELERLAAAAAWRVALSEAGLESSAGFKAWLAEHPANALAWRQVQGPWKQIGRHATAPEAMAMREEALQRARREQRRRRPTTRLVALVAATALIAAGCWLWAATAPDVYRTGLGERRTVTLADGSRVALDSGTLLKVKLGRDARRLELIRGQARFDVAHDAARPFTVHAGSQLVVATGTSFNVDMLGPNVLVTLIEGKVTVLKDLPAPLINPASQSQRPILARLSAGQQLIATAPPSQASGEAVRPVVRVTVASLDRAVAWESGQLIFENEPLKDVAERVGRYSSTPLVVEGPAANLRISGVFNAGDTATFVDAVQRGLPVRAARTGKGFLLTMTNP